MSNLSEAFNSTQPSHVLLKNLKLLKGCCNSPVTTDRFFLIKSLSIIWNPTCTREAREQQGVAMRGNQTASWGYTQRRDLKGKANRTAVQLGDCGKMKSFFFFFSEWQLSKLFGVSARKNMNWTGRKKAKAAMTFLANMSLFYISLIDVLFLSVSLRK